jgi:hypothetical protein
MLLKDKWQDPFMEWHFPFYFCICHGQKLSGCVFFYHKTWSLVVIYKDKWELDLMVT